MLVDDGEWFDDPPPEPPFVPLQTGRWAGVVDASGRVMLPECRNDAYVRELADVMNENSDRLVAAWRIGAMLAKEAGPAVDQGDKPVV